MSVPVWVIDTNVLVSAALTAGGTCDQIVRAAVDGRIRLAWSASMLSEYREVLLRPKFKFSPPVVASLLAVFSPNDQVTPVPAATLPDPDDEVFLATAMATPDKILVTGNGAHFPPAICVPVEILTPGQALQRLSEH
ncbi:MAG: putative toxin-antitoxin system toxin component, PIN family [Verrucomicrobiota bacterium]|nr:putative toxin-antitoxin system toxin component, PIN family [Verrucomicrobiota bacterium]